MKFSYFNDYEAMSTEGTRRFDEHIEGRKNPVCCLATGRSPLGMYRQLAVSSMYRNLHVIKLDEWLGLPMDHPATCEHYLRKEVLDPLKIPKERFIGFHSTPENPEAECARVQQELDRLQHIDVCVLGLGTNGHLGLNEPADFLLPNCHRATLAEQSQTHSMLQSADTVIKEGLTLGIADIFKAEHILLLVTGPGKKEVFEQLRQKKITTEIPASVLWLHPSVEVLVDVME